MKSKVSVFSKKTGKLIGERWVDEGPAKAVLVRQGDPRKISRKFSGDMTLERLYSINSVRVGDQYSLPSKNHSFLRERK